MRSAYITLGVPRDASIVQIQRAFHALSDFFSGQQLANLPGAADRYRDVHLAYRLLSDPDSRDAHDRKLREWERGIHSSLPRAPLFDRLSAWTVLLPAAVLVAAGFWAVHDAGNARAEAAARRSAAQQAVATSENEREAAKLAGKSAKQPAR
jgi:curved DNA-binding protein CbpA